MKWSENQQGFTLVEIVVTAAFISIAFIAIIEIFISAGNLTRSSRNLAIATQIAQQQVEYYRNTPFTSIPVSPPNDDFTSKLPASLGSPKSAYATISVPETGMKRVDIYITYMDGHKQKNVQVSTQITQKGLD